MSERRAPSLPVLAALAVAVALPLIPLLNYGTLSPCGILRVKMRQDAAKQGGLAGFMSQVLSDEVLNGMLAAEHGELTAGKCMKLLIDRH